MIVSKKQKRNAQRKNIESLSSLYNFIELLKGLQEAIVSKPVLHQELCGNEQKLSFLKHSLILQLLDGGQAIHENQKALQFQVPDKKACLATGTRDERRNLYNNLPHYNNICATYTNKKA